MLFGVKRMGELDRKAFHDACKERIAKDDFDVEFALIYSKWEHEIKQQEWYIDAEGKKKVNLRVFVMLDIICCSRWTLALTLFFAQLHLLVTYFDNCFSFRKS